MKYLRYGFRFFKKWWVLNIILAIQIVVSLLALNLTIGRANMQYQSVNLFSDLTQYKGVYYISTKNFEYHPDDAEETHEEIPPDIDKLKKIENIASIEKMSFISQSNQVIDTIVYPDFLIARLPNFFAKGLWETMRTHEKNKVPVVVLDGLYSRDCQSGKMIVAGSEREGETRQTCLVDVRGTAYTGGKYLSFAASGNMLSCLELFITHNDRFKEAPLFLTCQSAVEPYKEYVYWTMSNQFIFFDADITEEEYRCNIEELEKTGIVQSFEELYNNGIATARSDMSSLLALTLSIFAVAIIGLISLTILNTLRHLPVFSVYFICGCNWTRCILIILSYLLCIGILVGIGTGFLWIAMAIQDTFFEMQLLINSHNLWTSLAMLLSAVLLSIVPAYIALKARSPIQILHSKNR